MVIEKISSNEKDFLNTHWNKKFQLRDESGDVKFPILSKVVKSLLALSEANASVERTFSQIAHIIGKDRNRILPETVNAVITKSHIENSKPCYKQEITKDLMNNAKNARNLYFARNKEIDLNNNVPGPSQPNVIEETLSSEIKYQEDKIKLNNASAKKLMDEAHKIITENQKMENDLKK